MTFRLRHAITRAAGVAARFVAALLAAGILLGGAPAAAVMRDADCDDLRHRAGTGGRFPHHRMRSRADRPWRRFQQRRHGLDRGTGCPVVHRRLSRSRGQSHLFEPGRPATAIRKIPHIRHRRQLGSLSSVSNGFTVRTFFGKLKSVSETVPCFVFSRYAGHVANSTGFRHMIGGVYCEVVPSDEPVTAARIDQMMGKIRGDMF